MYKLMPVFSKELQLSSVCLVCVLLLASDYQAQLLTAINLGKNILITSLLVYIVNLRHGIANLSQQSQNAKPEQFIVPDINCLSEQTRLDSVQEKQRQRLVSFNHLNSFENLQSLDQGPPEFSPSSKPESLPHYAAAEKGAISFQVENRHKSKSCQLLVINQESQDSVERAFEKAVNKSSIDKIPSYPDSLNLKSALQDVIKDQECSEMQSISEEQEAPSNWHAQYLEHLPDGSAAFSEDKRDSSFVRKYCLVYSNPYFRALFNLNSLDINVALSQHVFKDVDAKNQPPLSFFTLLNYFKRLLQSGVTQKLHVFEITTASKTPDTPAAGLQSHNTPFFVSVKFFKIQIDDQVCIGVCVSNFSQLQLKSVRQITKKFQNTLTNALSHERLTPLNMIINGCEAIKKKLTQQSQQNSLYHSVQSSNRDRGIELSEIDLIWASSKCMQMLTTSQLQNYQVDCQKLKVAATSFGIGNLRPEQFHDFLKELVRPFQIKNNRRNVKVIVDINDERLQAHLASGLCTDYSVYRSILFHLMQNASKYSPEHSVIDVTVKFEPLSQPSDNITGYLVTSITDRGNGFDAKTRKLKRFGTFQLDGSIMNSSEVQGVGIGLSTAYTLSRYMGGDLNVESVQNGRAQSTTATFSVVFTDSQYCATFHNDLECLKNQDISVDICDEDHTSILDYAAKLGHELDTPHPHTVCRIEQRVIQECVMLFKSNDSQCSIASDSSMGNVSEQIKDGISSSVFRLINFQANDLSPLKGKGHFQHQKLSCQELAQIKQKFVGQLGAGKQHRDFHHMQSVEQEEQKDAPFAPPIKRNKTIFNSLSKLEESFQLNLVRRISDRSKKGAPKFNKLCTKLCETKVLICDDDDFNLIVIEEMLSQLGIQCMAFLSGVQAVQCFQKRLQQTCCSRAFELVLTDIQMPGWNGYEVCTRIMDTQNAWFASMKKQLTPVKFKARACPVVAVTAFTDDSVKVQAKKVGMKEVINKPVSHEKLVEILRKYT